MHHLLHHHRQPQTGLQNAVALPVTDGAPRPQAAPAVQHCLQQRLFADHIQVSVLLPGKRHLRQIFGSRRGTHRHRRGAQFLICPAQSIRQFRGQAACAEPAAHRLRGGLQRRRVARLKRFDLRQQAFFQIVGSHKSLVSSRGNDKTARGRITGAGQPPQVHPLAPRIMQLKLAGIQGQDHSYSFDSSDST